MLTTAQSVQVKVTLPAQLQQFVQSKADKFGMTVSSYIKHLVLDDVRDMDMPIFTMSAQTEEIALKALEEHRQGKTTEIKDIDEFLADL
jgi:antitoxin component of RelBE/YafQ-DinJ toxin-antitoxin module